MNSLPYVKRSKYEIIKLHCNIRALIYSYKSILSE